MKDKILRLIELKLQIEHLENTDTERQEIRKSGSYAIAEGYMTENMKQIEELQAEIESIEI